MDHTHRALHFLLLALIVIAASCHYESKTLDSEEDAGETDLSPTWVIQSLGPRIDAAADSGADDATITTPDDAGTDIDGATADAGGLDGGVPEYELRCPDVEPGFRSIINLEFGPTALPIAGFAVSGDVDRGVIAGMVSASSARPESVLDLGDGNYAFRSVKRIGSPAGSSGDGRFIVKEDDPGNTLGVTFHSYEEWQEHIVMRMYGEGGTNDFEYLSVTGAGKFGGLRGATDVGDVVPGRLILMMRRGPPIGGYRGGAAPTAGPGDYTTRLFVEMFDPGGAYPQNVELEPRFNAGPRWQHIDYYFHTNTLGLADGVFRAWVNGVLVTEYTDVVYRDEATPNIRGLTAVNWAQVYGGTGGAKTRTDYQDVDRICVSVRGVVD